MKQILKKINLVKLAELVMVGMLLVLPVATPAYAQFVKPPCGSTGVPCQTTDPSVFLTNIINVLLGLAAVVAVLFLIIGGFWYITSAGNEETAEKGKNTAINAIIGLVIIILSYVIVNVVAGLVFKTSQ